MYLRGLFAWSISRSPVFFGRNVRTIYVKELRDTLRDRRTLLVAVVLPVLINPLLFIGLTQFLLSQTSKLKAKPFKVAVYNAAEAPELLQRLENFTPLARSDPGPGRLVPEVPADQRTARVFTTPPEQAVISRLLGIERQLADGQVEAARRALESAGLSELANAAPRTHAQRELAWAVRALDSGHPEVLVRRLDQVPLSANQRADVRAWLTGEQRPEEAQRMLTAWALTDRVRAHRQAVLERVIATLVGADDDDDGSSVDVVLVIPAHFELDLKNQRPRLAPEIYFHGASDSSDTARAHVAQVLKQYAARVEPLAISAVDVEPGSKGLAEIAKFIPYVIVLMVLSAAFTPAIDLMAGEKERGTIETLLISPADRHEIISGKFLTVFTIAVAATALNLASLGVTVSVLSGMVEDQVALGAAVTEQAARTGEPASGDAAAPAGNVPAPAGNAPARSRDNAAPDRPTNGAPRARPARAIVVPVRARLDAASAPALLARLARAARARPRAIVLEMHTLESTPAGALAVAEALPTLGVPVWAWVPEPLTGPSALLALTCERLALHPEVALTGLDRKATAPDVPEARRLIALVTTRLGEHDDARGSLSRALGGSLPEALYLRPLVPGDPPDAVARARIVTESERRTLSESEATGLTPLATAGEPLRLSAADAVALGLALADTPDLETWMRAEGLEIRPVPAPPQAAPPPPVREPRTPGETPSLLPRVGLASYLLVFALMVPAAALFGALALALSAFAKSYREGQYYLTPAMLVVLPLSMVTLLPGVEFSKTPELLFVPVTNIVILFRDLLTGTDGVEAGHVVLVLGMTVLYAALALRWATSVFYREDVLFREAAQFSWRFWQRPGPPRLRPSAAAAGFAYVVALILNFYVGQSWLTRGATQSLAGGSPGPFALALVLSEALLLALPVLLYVRLSKLAPRAIFSFRRVRPQVYAALPLIASGAVVLVLELAALLQGGSGGPVGPQAPDPVTQALGMLSPWGAVALMAVVPAIFEELLFRGYIFAGLARDARRAFVPIVLTAALFGLMHGTGRITVTAAGGLLLTYVYWRTASLTVAMLTHALYNGLIAALQFVPALAPVGAFLLPDAGPAGTGHVSPLGLLLGSALLLAGGWLFLRAAPRPRGPLGAFAGVASRERSADVQPARSDERGSVSLSTKTTR